jgi:hypothetical protein
MPAPSASRSRPAAVRLAEVHPVTLVELPARHRARHPSRGEHVPQTLVRPVVSRHRRAGALWSLVAVACVAAAVPLLDRLSDPPRADLTFTNDTVWDVGVEVVLGDGRRLPVATIDAETTRSIEEIPTPGATWRFRWTFQGRVVARSDLADGLIRAAGDRVSVPAEVGDALRARGAAPAP